MAERSALTLAHSPDPDDAFMWWPITGKIAPDGGQLSPAVIDTGRFRFKALPADIEVLNRRAAESGYDILQDPHATHAEIGVKRELYY